MQTAPAGPDRSRAFPAPPDVSPVILPATTDLDGDSVPPARGVQLLDVRHSENLANILHQLSGPTVIRLQEWEFRVQNYTGFGSAADRPHQATAGDSTT